MKVLVIAAHPDDEIFGVGGTILKHVKKGNQVYICIVTVAYTPQWAEDVIKNKRQEALKASKMLGVEKTFFCELPTVKLDTIPQVILNGKISECVNKIKPDIVYTHHKGDINKDHRLVFDATMIAVRPKPNFFVKKVYSYECLSSTEWSATTSDFFMPNVYENINEYLDKKIEILKCYQTEIKNYPHPLSTEGIRILANRRGLTVGINAAESFMLIRGIND